MLDSAPPQQLKPSVTLWLAVFYGLGVTIGAGIYVLVGIAAGRSGMHAPLAFVLAALVMSFSAASFAELGTRMPVSASGAAYVEKAFNRPWLAVVVVPPDELARSSALLALAFERLTGIPLKTMSMIAVVATLKGIIVDVIMISQVLYGLASQGNLPQAMAHLNPRTGMPLLTAALGISAILLLALAVPMHGFADLTPRFTLVVFAIFNIALIRIKSRETAPPLQVYACPRWVPVAGLVSSIGLLFLDPAVS